VVGGVLFGIGAIIAGWGLVTFRVARTTTVPGKASSRLVDCVSLNPAKNSNRFIVAGYPLNEELIGPSSAAWGRLPGEYGKVAFVTTDGGAASPLPDGVRRPARLLRVEFPEAPAALRSM
jgi:hypothetical protein